MKKLTDFSNREILIAPSILAADFANLQSEIQAVEVAGAELLHLDVMDAHFVPNLSFGPPVVAALRKHSQMIFDVHLMITNPSHYITPFQKAGADHITFHIECDESPEVLIPQIRAAGCTVGISLKPKTPLEKVLPYLAQVDLVLVMSVEPGFGGQSFMSGVMPKVKALREAVTAQGLNTQIQIDGGIDIKTAPIAKANGANNLVAGTAVFRYPEGISAAIAALR